MTRGLRMKNWLLAALIAVVTVATWPVDAMAAKRFGGGGSAGMQRNMPARGSSADAGTPAKPAAAPQATPQPGAAPQGAAAATGAAATGAAAAGKRNWLGPIAGLAAGLGIAALLSHFGLGEAFANMMMMALLAVAAVLLVTWLMRRFGNKGQAGANRNPAGLATAGAPADAAAPSNAGGAQVSWPQSTERSASREGSAASTFSREGSAASSFAREGSAAASFGRDGGAELAPLASGSADSPAKAAPALPADFDRPAFERIAKMIFIRMQAANDSGDLNDLRSFTTPELFAHVRLELQERGAAPQQTDVVEVSADVLDWVRESDRNVVSVRYHGRIRETQNGPVEAFDEVWHLVQAHDGGGSWAIAGIQQTH
jgi:predicted lipid-binding transport protein (Tim44 family)